MSSRSYGFFAFLAIGIRSLACTDDASAVTRHVPADYASVRAALLAAAPDDTVEIACGSYREHDLFVPAGIVIRSETGLPECATIDASGLGRVLRCESPGAPTIEGLTLRNARGGAITCIGTSPLIQRCRLADNLASDGAALFCDAAASPVVAACEVTGNESAAFWVQGSSHVRIHACTFTNNGNDSPAIFVRSASVTMSDSHLHHNRGRVVEASEASTFNASSTVFSDNTRGLFADGASMTLTECRIESNESSGLTAIDSDLRMTSCVARENTVTGTDRFARGGGLHLTSSTAAITDCKFLDNKAFVGGGAFVTTSAPVFLRCEFRNNRGVAGSRGGGFSAETGGSPELIDCTFVGNESSRGGGLSLRSTPSAVLLRCVIERNESSQSGAGIDVIGASLELESCILNYNSTPGDGAAIHALTGDLDLRGCTIVMNKGGPGRAAIRLLGDLTTLSLRQSIVAHHLGLRTVSCDAGSLITATCTDLWGNAGGDWVDCVASQVDENGNFSMDPRFCRVDPGDFRLQSDSPCLPENSNSCDLVGALGLGDCSGVAVVPATWARIKTQYR